MHLPSFFWVAVLAVVTVVPFASAAGNPEDARLEAFFKAYLKTRFREQPMDATRLGDREHDDQLDDVSPKARAAWVERDRKTLADLPRQVDKKKLSRDGQIDYEIFEHDLAYGLWQAENERRFEIDPRVYNDYISDSIFLLLTQSTAPKSKTMSDCVARMAYIPRVVAAAKAGLKAPAKAMLETAIRQNRGAIAFYDGGLFQLTGETPALSDLMPAAAKVVLVLKDYQTFLESLRPQATEDWRLGKEKFAKKLELELNAGLTAAEVLAEAETEFTRVEREMYVIARQLWSSAYPKTPLPPDDAEGRRATIQRVLAHFNTEHSKPEELVKDVRATVAKVKAFIKEKDLLRLPDPDRCQVLEMPEFRRGNSTAYLDPAPPLDPKAGSVYAVSPPPHEWDARTVDSYLQEYNNRMVQVLTIHEAYPGHYVQLEYSNRHPSLIRRVLSSGTFAEGWAVYTEQMMLDQGYGDGDPVLRLNQLKFYLRAVANAILDNKMHCTDYSDDEALEFLTQRVYQSKGEALGKIVRSKQSSCQLSTYFVGRTAFYRLRQAVQREQGEKFDLGRYHEAVMDHGTLPVKYLPELVRKRLEQPR